MCVTERWKEAQRQDVGGGGLERGLDASPPHAHFSSLSYTDTPLSTFRSRVCMAGR